MVGRDEGRGKGRGPEKYERPRASHGNIMPQRPRAHHLSGVPAENDHWLRRTFTLSILFSSRQRRIYLRLAIYFSGDRNRERERGNSMATDEKTERTVLPVCSRD